MGHGVQCWDVMGQDTNTDDPDTERVRVYTRDKEWINDHRRGDDTQADVIRRLLDDEEDPVVHVEPSIDISPDTLAEALDDALDCEGSTLTYDDVKTACEAAIQDQLPADSKGAVFDS